MRRLRNMFIFSFLFLFVAETFGVYKFNHTCGNEKTFESFYIEKSPCCCGDEDEEAGGCCKNETTIVQFKEESSIVSAHVSKTPDNIATDLFYQPISNNELGASFCIVSEFVGQYGLYQKPPPRVRFCIFLI